VLHPLFWQVCVNENQEWDSFFVKNGFLSLNRSTTYNLTLPHNKLCLAELHLNIIILVYYPQFLVTWDSIVYWISSPRFLDVFEKLRKAAIGFVMSIRPSAFTEQFGSNWTDFRELFSKIC